MMRNWAAEYGARRADGIAELTATTVIAPLASPSRSATLATSRSASRISAIAGVDQGDTVTEPTTDAQLDSFLEIRKPGAHLEEDVIADDFVLMLGVDLVNYPKFPKVDDTVTYP